MPRRKRDIYIKGFRKAILKASTLESGRYFDSDSGKRVHSIDEIESGIVDDQGNVLFNACEIDWDRVERRTTNTDQNPKAHLIKLDDFIEIALGKGRILIHHLCPNLSEEQIAKEWSEFHARNYVQLVIEQSLDQRCRWTDEHPGIGLHFIEDLFADTVYQQTGKRDFFESIDEIFSPFEDLIESTLDKFIDVNSWSIYRVQFHDYYMILMNVGDYRHVIFDELYQRGYITMPKGRSQGEIDQAIDQIIERCENGKRKNT